MSSLHIPVIIGSTRQNRFSEKPAAWIHDALKTQPDVTTELLDLRDFPLPFYDQASTPSRRKELPDVPHLKEWSEKITAADGFVIVTPEYNHGYPAVLKNAIDWLYAEWKYKPVGFIAYGSSLGARSIEQLRQVVIEVGMMPIRSALQIPSDVFRTSFKPDVPFDPSLLTTAFTTPTDRLAGFLNELTGYAQAAKAMRE